MTPDQMQRERMMQERAMAARGMRRGGGATLSQIDQMRAEQARLSGSDPGLSIAQRRPSVSDEQIKAFVAQNMGNPQAIMQAMEQYGVSPRDISRATGYSAQQIGDYFQQAAASMPGNQLVPRADPAQITGRPEVRGGGSQDRERGIAALGEEGYNQMKAMEAQYAQDIGALQGDASIPEAQKRQMLQTMEQRFSNQMSQAQDFARRQMGQSPQGAPSLSPAQPAAQQMTMAQMDAERLKQAQAQGNQFAQPTIKPAGPVNMGPKPMNQLQGQMRPPQNMGVKPKPQSQMGQPAPVKPMQGAPKAKPAGWA